jgi:KDO2-lipid IV(A) lauroyltransferase
MTFRLDHWLQDRLLRGLIWGLLRLPYKTRLAVSGWVSARLIGPIAGYNARSRENLARVWPDMTPAERNRLARAVSDNVGRSFIELYSTTEFLAAARALPPQGAGLAELAEAAKENRPVLLITGHFGNYEASREALTALGYQIGGLYRPMKNQHFNGHYVAAMGRFGTPLFPRGREGLGDMIRFLKSGGMLGMVIDQHMNSGEILDFLGLPARTALSAADLALKYNALLIPAYAIRQPDGVTFQTQVEAPIPHTDARQMTQALNDSLAAQVRAHPEQWFWIHRRWK